MKSNNYEFFNYGTKALNSMIVKPEPEPYITKSTTSILRGENIENRNIPRMIQPTYEQKPQLEAKLSKKASITKFFDKCYTSIKKMKPKLSGIILSTEDNKTIKQENKIHKIRNIIQNQSQFPNEVVSIENFQPLQARRAPPQPPQLPPKTTRTTSLKETCQEFSTPQASTEKVPPVPPPRKLKTHFESHTPSQPPPPPQKPSSKQAPIPPPPKPPRQVLFEPPSLKQAPPPPPPLPPQELFAKQQKPSSKQAPIPPPPPPKPPRQGLFEPPSLTQAPPPPPPLPPQGLFATQQTPYSKQTTPPPPPPLPPQGIFAIPQTKPQQVYVNEQDEFNEPKQLMNQTEKKSNFGSKKGKIEFNEKLIQNQLNNLRKTNDNKMKEIFQRNTRTEKISTREIEVVNEPILPPPLSLENLGKHKPLPPIPTNKSKPNVYQQQSPLLEQKSTNIKPKEETFLDEIQKGNFKLKNVKKNSKETVKVVSKSDLENQLRTALAARRPQFGKFLYS